MMVLQSLRAGSEWVSRLMRDHENLSAFWVDESGQDMMEYALVAALLSLCAVASLQALSAEVVQLWLGVLTSFSSAV